MALESQTEEAPAIRALGSLFKITQVFIWDDAPVAVREISPMLMPDDNLTEAMDSSANGCSKVELTVEEFTAASEDMEDMELIRQMDALGLPTSFSTNKERKTVKAKVKRNNLQERYDHTDHKNFKEDPSHIFRTSEGGTVCSSEVSCNSTSGSMDGMVVKDDNFKSFHIIASSDIQSDFTRGEENADCFEVCVHSCDWKVIWDAFYMRNYFYNIITHETTWEPPPGMEYLVFSAPGLVTDAVERDDIDYFSASDDIEALDVCGVQDKTEILLKAGNYDSAIPGVLCVQYNDVENLEPGVTFLDEHQGHKCTSPPVHCKNLDELEGDNVCPDDKKICNGSSTVIQDNVASLQSILHELGSEDILRSDPQPVFIDSKEDEWNGHGLLYEREKNGSSREETDDEVLQVPSLDSLGATSTEAVYEGNWSSMLQKHIDLRTEELVEHQILTATKRKRKVRTRVQRKLISDDKKEVSLVPCMVEGLSADIVKYWCQRYLLFSRFDEGIKLDEEGWFSVTPEPIARHHATRCGGGTIIDCFTGVGGNAIQFAKWSDHVIGIDIDPQKIDYAQHNAAIYGVGDKIDFIKGDFFHFAPMLKADTVFMSPPWGGPDYAKVQTYDIKTMLKPQDGTSMFKIARMIACRIVMFLPRNVDLNQLAELSLLFHPPWSLEVEKNFLNGRLKAITAYFHSSEGSAFCL